MSATTTHEPGRPGAKDLQPTRAELLEIIRQKYGEPERLARGPRIRLRHGYFTPEDHYEALVSRLVTPETTWIDVGCGRNIFPYNPKLGQVLSERCRLVVGVDPDQTLDENIHVHERIKSTIEDLQCERTFALATLRMVAEHIAQPEMAVATLAKLVEPGGKAVIYTVNQWTPVALLARLVPFPLHHAIKWRLWRAPERDTFPVVYRMNTRKRLTGLFESAGFRERYFAHLDDCRIFVEYNRLHALELLGWRLFRAARLTYPENCLLAVYERRA